MSDIDIRSKCSINSNQEKDTFVGLKCDAGDISINFPLGYHVSEDDNNLRKDIMLLFATLAVNTKRRDSELLGPASQYDKIEFPMQSYIYVLKDYILRGYFIEQEVGYNVSKTGKINWSRTIKTQRPYIQDNDIFYLDFVTKKNTVKENELITLIHEYCVNDSFEKIGWLFTKSMPKKPRIMRKDRLFKAVIKDKLSTTFNDCNRRLFQNMLSIIEYQGDNEAQRNYYYGTYRFEYVWERMIDKVFGIGNKADYFPKTTWFINSCSYDNDYLKPDTIMIYQNNVYILDAKYYKYGVTGRQCDLPGSPSISKQITYGEYVSGEKKFKKLHGLEMKVFNAFLMPFDSVKNKGNIKMLKVGEALSDWKKNTEEYQKIQGILLDVKSLMSINVYQEDIEIMKLAELIEKKS